MDNQGKIGVYKRTARLCKKKGIMNLADDMPPNPNHGETGDYIP